MADRVVKREIAKGCSPSRSRYCLETCGKNEAKSKYFSVYTIKKRSE